MEEAVGTLKREVSPPATPRTRRGTFLHYTMLGLATIPLLVYVVYYAIGAVFWFDARGMYNGWWKWMLPATLTALAFSVLSIALLWRHKYVWAMGVAALVLPNLPVWVATVMLAQPAPPPPVPLSMQPFERIQGQAQQAGDYMVYAVNDPDVTGHVDARVIVAGVLTPGSLRCVVRVSDLYEGQPVGFFRDADANDSPLPWYWSQSSYGKQGSTRAAPSACEPWYTDLSVAFASDRSISTATLSYYMSLPRPSAQKVASGVTSSGWLDAPGQNLIPWAVFGLPGTENPGAVVVVDTPNRVCLRAGEASVTALRVPAGTVTRGGSAYETAMRVVPQDVLQDVLASCTAPSAAD